MIKAETLRILAHGGIGDTIMLTATLRHLKQELRVRQLIVYCSYAYHREVLLNNPNIDALRLVNFAYRVKTFWHNYNNKSPFARSYLEAFQYFPPSLYKNIHAAQIIAYGIGFSISETRPELFLTASERNKAALRLAVLPKPIIAIHSTSFNTIKSWDPVHWRRVVDAMPNYTFVQLGGNRDARIEGATDFRGVPLRESFSLLQACDALVGIDSGLAHAAAALNIPRVILFGATSPARIGYHDGRHIYNPPICSPCFDTLLQSKCPLGHQCMKAITYTEVVEAITQVLSKPTSSAPDIIQCESVNKRMYRSHRGNV